MADQNRGEVSRNLVVRLHEVTEILQVTHREDALAAVLFQLLEQIGAIDAGNQRSLIRERPRDIAESVIPSAVTREEQREVPHFRLRLEDVHFMEAAMRKRLAAGK